MSQDDTPSLARSVLSLAFDGLLLLLGTVGAFGLLYGQLSLHWALAALLAPIGGVLFWGLGQLGSMMVLLALIVPFIGLEAAQTGGLGAAGPAAPPAAQAPR